MPNKDKDKEVVSTQWEMGDVEKAGLLKMDFLGLRNLTSLAAAVKLVEERTGKPLDLFNLPLDDEATYKLLQRGDAKGVFQLDGAGIRDLLVKMKPDRFADLIAHPRALSARPAQRRHGRRIRRRQARPQAADLSPPGHEGGPGRDLRGHGLPRTGHAHPEPPGRHRAVAGVRVHQGDLEEEVRDHRPVDEAVRRRGRSHAGWRRTRPRRSST